VPIGISPLHHVAKTYHAVTSEFERFMGMSRARWVMLRLLSEQTPLTQADLAHHLGVDAAAVTRQVKQLEREGLVTRRPVPEDNRYTQVALSEAGLRYVAVKRPQRDQFEARVLAGLPPEEIAQLLQTLARIRRNLENVPAVAELAPELVPELVPDE
jgi:DNA-binding MarR family transcriptional regulator